MSMSSSARNIHQQLAQQSIHAQMSPFKQIDDPRKAELHRRHADALSRSREGPLSKEAGG